MSRRTAAASLLLFLVAGWSGPASADRRTDWIVSALGGDAHVVESTDEWTWTQVVLADEEIPLKIDILVTNRARDRRVLYMFPGATLNFESNFFTPRDQNLAHFMRERGYIVIGINSRADSLDPGANDPRVADWGLWKLREDAHHVIRRVRAFFPQFDIVGHSLGALQALDYAAAYPHGGPQKLFLIDTIGPYDPETEADLMENARVSSEAYQTLLSSGLSGEYYYTRDTGHQTKLILGALAAGSGGLDSGVPRPLPGNFTYEGFLHYAVIHSNALPGPTSELTMLPELWFVGATWAGDYAFVQCEDEPERACDEYHLEHTSVDILAQYAAAIGSGVVPTAQLRDLLAVAAGRYAIPFRNIEATISWVNAGLGIGYHPYAARLIERATCQRVRYSAVPGYGHGDPVLGQNAVNDFWPVLVGN